MNSLIIIFGGTFDPIHNGHLSLSHYLKQHFRIQNIYYCPCRLPALKQAPQAESFHRLEMLKLALQNDPTAIIDDRELQRSGKSYSIDTLKEFRHEFPDTPIAFVLGKDAFQDFERWHRWQEFLSFAHLIVFDRPNQKRELSPALTELLHAHGVSKPKKLEESPEGHILSIRIHTPDISSTEIRSKIARGIDVHEEVPDKVLKYIRENNLYL